MNCCQMQGLEELFSDQLVSKELASYRKNGPGRTTRMMIDALKAQGVQGMSLLDIGGGVGAIQHQLLKAGVQSAVDVDASRAYLTAAKSEAMRRGLEDRVRFLHGNFVETAEKLPPADVVTLDRVYCCYHDIQGLVDTSARHAQQLYGVVYPRDAWWTRIGVAVMNFVFKLQKNPYRAFVHPTRVVEEMLRKHGLERRFYKRTFMWQVAVYSRPAD
jgi:magnesium-protoporphyrin O-methyltransferase